MQRFIVSVALVAALQGPASAVPMFSDVPESHWAYDAVRVLAAKGIIEGYPAPGEKTFNPPRPKAKPQDKQPPQTRTRLEPTPERPAKPPAH